MLIFCYLLYHKTKCIFIYSEYQIDKFIFINLQQLGCILVCKHKYLFGYSIFIALLFWFYIFKFKTLNIKIT